MVRLKFLAAAKMLVKKERTPDLVRLRAPAPVVSVRVD